MDPVDVERELAGPRPSVAAGPGPVPPAWSDRVRSTLVWFGPARIVGGAVLLVVALAGGWWLLRSPAPPVERSLPYTHSGTGPRRPATGPIDTSVPTTASTVVVVHVAGAVVAPGLVHLPSGSRVADAIAAAGGALPEADVNAINLAEPVVDGTRIYVPVVGEAVDGGTAAAGTHVHVDLNRAAEMQFDALPGVGPALARAIVAYRSAHGPFKRVEDLLNVPGIGPSKLALFRQLVSV